MFPEWRNLSFNSTNTNILTPCPLLMYSLLIPNQVHSSSLSLNFPNLEVDAMKNLPFTIKSIRNCILYVKTTISEMLHEDILNHTVHIKTSFSDFKSLENMASYIRMALLFCTTDWKPLFINFIPYAILLWSLLREHHCYVRRRVKLLP